MTKVNMRVGIYYNGKLIHTVIVPRSITDPKEAVQEVRDKLSIRPIFED